MRIQFYPKKELEEKLSSESSYRGISINMLVNDILCEHYKLIPSGKLSDAQIEKEVLKEIIEYADDLPAGSEFDMSKASGTYRNVKSLCTGNPQALKARIGREFSRRVGKGELSQIEPVYQKNGKPKKTTDTRAAIYQKKRG